MADPHSTCADEDRQDWEMHRAGEPLDLADAAFERLFAKHFNWVSAVFRRWGYAQDAEDAAQEVFIYEFKGRGRAILRYGGFESQIWLHIRHKRSKDWERAQRRPREAEFPAGYQLAADARSSSDEAANIDEVLSELPHNAAEHLAVILRACPGLTEIEAIHFFLRVQRRPKFTSKFIVDYINHRLAGRCAPWSVASERQRWRRLKEKLKRDYSIDVDSNIE